MYAFPAKLFGQNLAAVFVIGSKMLSSWCVVIEVQIYQVHVRVCARYIKVC